MIINKINPNIANLYKFSKNFLYPLNRSLTGKGVRKTLMYIKSLFPNLNIKFFKSNIKVYDWKVPAEWKVKKAYIKDFNKKKIVDFEKNNLHLIGYSSPINKKLKKEKLLKKIFFLKKQPNAIPYITSYYKKNWGFCCTYNQYLQIKKEYKKNQTFDVFIDSSFNKNGKMNYAEYFIKGKSKKEILISTYICHPSMANNELSGPIVSMALINYFKKRRQMNYSLRFLFIPETIGSIAYINRNIKHLKKNVIGGYNLSCIGDEKNHSCMFSKKLNHPTDLSLVAAYKKLNIKNFKIYSFLKRGSDERQFNSPGVDIPIASIFRSKYGEYKEYHTSLDNFNLVTVKGLNGGYKVAREAIKNLDNIIIPKSKFLCEPQLGKRGMYNNLSKNGSSIPSQKYLDFLQYSDGNFSLQQISKIIKASYTQTKSIYKLLKKKNLVS